MHPARMLGIISCFSILAILRGVPRHLTLAFIGISDTVKYLFLNSLAVSIFW